MKPWILAILALSLPTVAFTQTNPASQAARQWRQQHERAIVDEYIQFLSIPNVATDKPNIQRNTDFLVKMMQARGVKTRLLTAAGANPVVYGELVAPGAPALESIERGHVADRRVRAVDGESVSSAPSSFTAVHFLA